MRVYFDVFRQSFSPIHVFLMLYFDVFRQSSCFNFYPLNQSSFNVFGVFVDSRGRRDPCKTYSGGSILTFFDKVSVLIFIIRAEFVLYFWSFCRQQRRVTELVIYFLEFLQELQGGPLINVFLRVYFDVFRQSSRFILFPIKTELVL